MHKRKALVSIPPATTRYSVLPALSVVTCLHSPQYRLRANPGDRCSGFYLDPELASRDEGAPREGRTRGAAGGISLSSPQATTNSSQNFKILIFSRVTANLGL
jgi:hypothetical protein